LKYIPVNDIFPVSVLLDCFTGEDLIPTDEIKLFFPGDVGSAAAVAAAMLAAVAPAEKSSLLRALLRVRAVSNFQVAKATTHLKIRK
jgi:hypothetical protein